MCALRRVCLRFGECGGMACVCGCNLTILTANNFHSLEREFVVQEDFMKAVRKVADNKKLESKLDYKPV